MDSEIDQVDFKDKDNISNRDQEQESDQDINHNADKDTDGMEVDNSVNYSIFLSR
jgi:hypothetical protein